MVSLEGERPGSIQRIHEIISLGGAALRATYGEEAFPKHEILPRPERIDGIIRVVKEVLESKYGPESFTIDSDSVYWISEQEFIDTFKEKQSKTPKLLKTAMTALGVPNFGEITLEESNVFLSVGSREPLEIYICSDRYKHLDLSTFTGLTEFDFEIGQKMILHSIFYSTIPKYTTDNDFIFEVLEKRLELDRKEYPKRYPQMDKDGFSNLIDALKLMAREDATRYFVLDGTEIKCRHGSREMKKDQNGEIVEVTTYEDFATAGVLFLDSVTEYLKNGVMNDYWKIISKHYPQDAITQKALRVQFNKLTQPTLQEKFELAQTEAFLKAVGILGHKNVFRAFHKSEIPEKFFEAKKKNKNLFYPR